MRTATSPSYRLGPTTVEVISEHVGNPMPLSEGMPAVTEGDLRTAAGWLQDPAFADTPEDSILNLSWHSYVLRLSGTTVVVDTGLGNGKDRPGFIPFAANRSTDVPGRLATAGIRPEDVDVVVCTHLHFDHVGWNTVLREGQWVPMFPQARYLFTRADYEHFRSLADQDPVNGPAYRDSVAPVVEAGQAELIEPGHVVFDDGSTRLTLEDAAGHSPGSILARLDSGGGQAVFSGDLVHHPIQLVRPGAINLAMEHAPEAAAAARIRIVAELADSGTLVFPAHFTGSPGGRITAEGTGYRWAPLVESDPEVTGS